MKNTNIKYKLNFKNMKKGLLTVLLASLVLVGCQNYDDQFDDLNAQISALKSQVDGLSSLSGQVSSLSGTISGLQAGVSAAQAAATAAGASADAATAAGNAAAAAATASTADLSGLEASLATLATDVAAVQASLATAATASAVTALQAELDAIETDLADLLASSNIYSTDVTVTNATTLNSALALGNKLNVLNATLTITGYASMDYASVQTLVDRVNTMTGNLVYSAYDSTGTEIVFNSLVSAGDIDVTQPGGYSFPKLQNAGTINLQNNFVTTVTNVSFPALTTVTDMQTENASTDKFTVTFTAATNVDFGALVNTPGTKVEITTKKDATLDLSSWNSKNAAGTYVNQTLTLNGPASFTNGTAAGTFASTGLPGNTVGTHDGTINLTNVATAAVHNFRGTLNVNGGVKNFTGNNITGITLSSATALETLNLTMMRDNDPGLSASAVTADATSANTEQNVSISSTHAKLTSVTLTGALGTIDIDGAAALTTIDLTGADAFDVTIANNDALTSYTGASKAMNFVFDDNDLVTSLSTAHTSKTETGDLANTVTVTDNAELASLTLSMDDVDALTITGNAKLATIDGSALKDNGASTVTTATVDISNNAFVASLVRDDAEAVALTAAQVGTSTDKGAITSSSGLSTLDTYLAHAKAATGNVYAWFDTVTKYETQSTYGGAYTNSTSSLTAPTSYNATEAAATASKPYVYIFQRDVVAGTTSGARAFEIRTYAYDVSYTNNAFAVPALNDNEGIVITGSGGTAVTFKDDDSYLSAANSTSVQTVDDLVGFLNADTSLVTTGNTDVIAARDSAQKAFYTITYIDSTLGAATAGAISTTGKISFQFGSQLADGAANNLLTADIAATGTQDDIAKAVMTAINSDADYSAITVTSTGSNVFVVTKNVTAGGSRDMGPLVSFPSISFNIDAAQTSTTAGLTPSAYNVSSNLAGKNSSLFALSSSKRIHNGLRVSLKNVGSVAFSSSTTAVLAAVSNTAILGTAGAADGADNLLVDGTNIAAYSATTNTSTGNYVTAFTDISAGTTTGTVTEISTDRTTW